MAEIRRPFDMTTLDRLWRRTPSGRSECIHILSGDPVDLAHLIAGALLGEGEYYFTRRIDE